jgi:hypothetical protein
MNESTFTLYAKGPKGTKHLPNLTVKNLSEAGCRAKCDELRELGYRNFDPRVANPWSGRINRGTNKQVN